jgi:hypothetical protein
MKFEMPTPRELAFEAAAAARVARREAGELEKLRRRADGDPVRFAELARAFYEEHAALVAEAMVFEPHEVHDYCTDRLHTLPTKAEEVGAWIEHIASKGAAELVEIRAFVVRGVLMYRERSGGRYAG